MPKAYLVGAGPGDPGLLTISALAAIRAADVVLYDRLVSDEILAFVPSSTEKIYVGKLEGEQNSGQAKIYQALIKAVHEEKTVLRLKGGEPLIFGRGGEEWNFLSKLGCDVVYIPGISSAVAAPGSAGIPLTARGYSSSFAVLTAQLEGGEKPDFSAYSKIETLVVLMGVKRRKELASEFISTGRSANEPVAFIERATRADQRIIRTNLGEVSKGLVQVESPAVMVIGEVVRFHDKLVDLVSNYSQDSTFNSASCSL